MTIKSLSLLVLGTLLAAFTTAPAMAQADFYNGKTITYIVATSPGGGYDTYGRLVAKYMEKHLPGSTIIVKNVPGAGHIVGANQLYAARPDGLTIGTFNTGLIYAQILQREGVQYDLRKMSFIGKAAADPRMFMVGTKTDIENYGDLKGLAEPIKVAVSGVGSGAYNDTKMLADVLGLRLELVPGFSGNEGEMSILRGEVAGTLGSRSSLTPFVENGFGRFIFQVGGAGDLPQAKDLTSDADGQSIVALITSQAELARLTAAPPGVPAERMATLVAAYRAALTDPALLADAKRIDIPIEPLFGSDVQDRVGAALNQSPATVAKIASVMNLETPKQTVDTILAAVEDGGRWIVFNGGDGKEVRSKVSGSRTKIVVAGAEAKRGALVQGMACVITYAPGDDNEPSLVEC